MANQSPTFIMKSMPTFPLKVELAIPPERPVMKGFITVDAVVKSKEEIKTLGEQNYEDGEFFDQLIQAVHGLGNDAGAVLEGEDAMKEVKEGKLSMYLVPAIVSAYFEQYGEARRKNSRTSQRR